jgi:hypothetical protein
VLSSIPANNTIETLDISNNKQLFDFSGIEKLKSLKNIDASFLFRIDRFPYSNKLEVLSLTHIDDISRTLLHFPIHNSLKQLDLSYNQNPNLNYLIVHNKSANTYLLRFPNLQSLKLIDCSLTGAFDLQNYNQITELDLSSNKLIGTSFLINYDILKSLSISSNELETLTFSPKQNTIKTLNIRYNPKLEDFSGLKELNNLENLYVANTQFNDLSILTCQNTLYHLDINYCKIKNLDLLVNFKKLRTISLNEPKSNELNILSKMENLKVINIKQNTLLSDKQKQEIKQQLKNKQVNFI